MERSVGPKFSGLAGGQKTPRGVRRRTLKFAHTPSFFAPRGRLVSFRSSSAALLLIYVMASLGGRPWSKDLTAPVAVAAVVLAVVVWKVRKSEIFPSLPPPRPGLPSRLFRPMERLSTTASMLRNGIEISDGLASKVLCSGRLYCFGWLCILEARLP